jgi:hypothetical protein
MDVSTPYCIPFLRIAQSSKIRTETILNRFYVTRQLKGINRESKSRKSRELKERQRSARERTSGRRCEIDQKENECDTRQTKKRSIYGVPKRQKLSREKEAGLNETNEAKDQRGELAPTTGLWDYGSVAQSDGQKHQIVRPKVEPRGVQGHSSQGLRAQ